MANFEEILPALRVGKSATRTEWEHWEPHGRTVFITWPQGPEQAPYLTKIDARGRQVPWTLTNESLLATDWRICDGSTTDR